MLNPFQALWLRPRLIAAIALGLVVAFLAPGQSIVTRALTGWCVGVVAYIALVVHLVRQQSLDDLRQQSSRLDDSAPVISLLAIAATLACFVAVATLVIGPRNSLEGWADILLSALTVICAWAFIQVVFTIHYAHLFYGDDEPGHSRGGLEFGGDEDPDFWDFLYFTITIGATAQTSDTNVTSKRMRRVVTVQETYAYFFNTALLALAINMAAGLAK